MTTTTKEIEAKISTDVWDRQKRWEMKREVLFEAARRLGAFDYALRCLAAEFQVERKRRQEGQPVSEDATNEAIEKWTDEAREFGGTCGLIGVACGKDVRDACLSHLLFTQLIGLLFRP